MEHRGIRTVIVPLDGSPKAEKVVPAAIEESLLHGAPLVLVRVVPYMELPQGQRSHGAEGSCPPDMPLEIQNDCAEADRYLREVLQRYVIEGGEVTVRYGDPFTQIASELRQWPGPLAVLASYATAVLPVGAHSELARRISGLNEFHILLVPGSGE